MKSKMDSGRRIQPLMQTVPRKSILNGFEEYTHTTVILFDIDLKEAFDTIGRERLKYKPLDLCSPFN